MKLTETVNMMNSTDYKERFRAEYFQLINRIDGLGAMLIKYRKGTLEFTPKCSIKLLDGQFNSMKMYATHLVERAKIEGVSLEEVIEKETDLISEEKETDEVEPMSEDNEQSKNESMEE